MNEEVPILDWVKLNNGDELTGILDYANDRFIHFYDFKGISDPNVVLAAIVWRQKDTEMRFSVYCSMYFPKLVIPRVKLLNRIAIDSCSIDIETVAYNPKREKFSIKK